MGAEAFVLAGGPSSRIEQTGVQASATNGDQGSFAPRENVYGGLSFEQAHLPLPSGQRRTYYVARIPRAVDQEVRNNIACTGLRLEDIAKERDDIRTAVQTNRSRKAELLEKLKPIQDKERACREAIQGKRTELDPFLIIFSKLKSSQSALGSAKGLTLCSSEEALNDKIADLHYQIHHESISLKEEKQLLRYIKQLESTRDQVRANSELQAELIQSLGPKEEIEGQYKVICHELEVIRKEHKKVRMEYEVVNDEIDKINKSLRELQCQFEKASAAQQEVYVLAKDLRKQDSAKNEKFYQNKRDIQVAKELASQKSLEELDNHCSKQIKEFFDIWNTDFDYRLQYLTNNERSTLSRFETLDGRLLDLREKPLQLENSPLSVPLDMKLGGSSNNLSNGYATNERLVSTDASLPEHAMSLDQPIMDMGHDEPVFTNSCIDSKSGQAECSENDDAVHVAKLKEKRRQEEMAKAREAAERKKKRVEKAEYKALLRAQKDAEHKQKQEREKKARRKAFASGKAAMHVPLEKCTVGLEGLKLCPCNAANNFLASTYKAQSVIPVPCRRPLFSKRRGFAAVTKSLLKDLPLWAVGLIVLATFMMLMVAVTIKMRVELAYRNE